METRTLSTAKLAAFKFFMCSSICLVFVSGCLPKEASEVLTGSSSTNGSFFAGVKTAVNLDGSRVRLTWDAPSLSISTYTIYSVAPGGSLSGIRTVPGTQTSVTLTGLSTGQMHTFRVVANADNQTPDTNRKDLSAFTYSGITAAQTIDSVSGQLIFPDMGQADAINIYCTNTYPVFPVLPTATITNFGVTNYTLSALSSGVTYSCKAHAVYFGQEDNNTAVQSFTPVGVATQIVFSTQPSATILAGVKFNPGPVVRILDALGNIVSAGPDSRARVTLSIATVSPTTSGTVSGTASMLAVNGVADFSNLVDLKTAGNTILTATKEDTSAVVDGSSLVGTAQMTVNSNQVAVNPGPASSLSTLTASPSSVTANGASPVNLTLTLRDQYGNPIPNQVAQFTSDQPLNDSVTPSGLTSTNSAGQIIGSVTSTVAGSRLISLTVPAGLGTVQVPITFVPGTPTKLVFGGGGLVNNTPAGTALADISVSVQDAFNNVVPNLGAGYNATLIIKQGPAGAVISPTAVPTVDLGTTGTGVFSGIILNTTNTPALKYKLAAQRAGLTEAVTLAFDITSGGATHLEISSTPTSQNSGACSGLFTVTAKDVVGNAVVQSSADLNFAFQGLSQAQIYASGDSSCTTPTSVIRIPRFSSSAQFRIRNQRAETINLSTSYGAFTTNTVPIQFLPTRITMSGPTGNKALSGACIPITLTSVGADSQPGPMGSNQSFPASLNSANPLLYSASNCNGGSLISPMNISFPQGQSSVSFYVQTIRVETFMLSLTTSGFTAPGALTISTHPAQILISQSSGSPNFRSGPTSDANFCKAFRVRLLNGAGNASNPVLNTTIQLSINSSSGNDTLKVFTNNTCSTENTLRRVTIATNASPAGEALFYLNDPTAENLIITASDIAANSPPSSAFNSVVGAYKLTIDPVGPLGFAPGDCSGSITVTARDFLNNEVIQSSALNLTLTLSGSSSSVYTGSSCSPAGVLGATAQINGTSSYTFSVKSTASENVNFTVSDSLGASGLQATNTLAIGFFNPPTATFGGWTSISALGAKVKAHAGVPSSITDVSRRVRLYWEPVTLSDAGITINGYHIYRGTVPDFNPVTPINSTMIAASNRMYEDTSPTLAAGTTYYYRISVVANGQVVQLSPRADLVVKIPMPIDNMALVHRWAANIETCKLMSSATDYTNNYRCPYTGPGSHASAQGTYFDMGRSYFMDMFETGCNYSFDTVNCGASGCIGSSAPPAGWGVEDSIYFNTDGSAGNNGGLCYIKNGGVWVSQYSASQAQKVKMMGRAPGLPPFGYQNQTIASGLCSQVSLSPLYSATGRLPSRKEHVIASAPPVGGSFSNCNGYSGAPGGISAAERVFSSGSNLVAKTGSSLTNGCQSRYGIQDLIGNMGDINNDLIKATNAGGGNNLIQAVSNASSSTDLTSFATTYALDNVIGPKCGDRTNWHYMLGSGQCSLITSPATTTNRIIVPLGLPVVSSASSTWGATLPVASSATGALTTSMLGTDMINLIPNRSIEDTSGATVLTGTWSAVSGGQSWGLAIQPFDKDEYITINSGVTPNLSAPPGRYNLSWLSSNYIAYAYDLGFRCMADVPE